VLGFGRSGTSLTMRLLNLLGVDVGPEEDLLPPQEAENPAGYWEPRWMMELNDELLARLDTVWWRPLQAEPGWERDPELDPLRERARDLLREKFGSAPLWGWKEPRTTLTLPFWRDLVPNARYVICLRNPADAISSLQRRPEPNLPIRAWGDLWLEYTARALQETQGSPRLLVFYEDLFRDARGEIARIASFLDLDPPAENGSLQRLLEEIRPGMRHHATSSLELAAAWGLAPATRAAFLALRAAEDARRAEPAADRHDQSVSEAIARVAPELHSEQHLLRVYEDAARDRLDLLHKLQQVADDRLGRMQELQRAAHDRLHLVERLERESEERLRALEVTTAELGAERRRHLSAARQATRELEGEVHRRDAEIERLSRWLQAVHSSASWRITAPLRAAKHALQRLPSTRPSALLSTQLRPAKPQREPSLLVGLSVSQVWWFALALTFLIAASDALIPHVVLIVLLTIGPFCALLTGRWTRTATVGIWALALAIPLAIPDKIWDTTTQLVDTTTVAVAALLSTSAASLIERRG
jgi:hypothetical protein